MFAKLYGNDENQILVKLGEDPENGNPEVRIYFQPQDLGVCSLALSWNDNSDESWGKAEKSFLEMNETKAIAAINKVYDQFSLKDMAEK